MLINQLTRLENFSLTAQWTEKLLILNNSRYVILGPLAARVAAIVTVPFTTLADVFCHVTAASLKMIIRLAETVSLPLVAFLSPTHAHQVVSYRLNTQTPRTIQLEQQVNGVSSQVAPLQQRIKELESQVQAKEQDLSTEKAQVNQVKNDLQAARQQEGALRQENQTKDLALSVERVQVSQLRNDLQAVRQENQAKDTALLAERTLVGQLRNDLQAACQQGETLRQDNQTIQTVRDGLQKERDGALQRLEESYRQNQLDNEEIGKYQAQLSDIQQRQVRLVGEKDKLKSEKKELDNKIRVLEMELQQFKKQSQPAQPAPTPVPPSSSSSSEESALSVAPLRNLSLNQNLNNQQSSGFKMPFNRSRSASTGENTQPLPTIRGAIRSSSSSELRGQKFSSNT